MLTLNDGRNELWQWDTGRTLAVDADCSQVHFSNKVFGRSNDVDVIDGIAIIPDILLQTDKDLTAWAFVGTAENGYTKISKVFKVNKRNKPADYVFTPPEQTTLEEIKEKIEYLESIQDPDAIKNAVEDYLDRNPVEAPVQSVNGKTGKVELTAEDVGAISQDKLQEATNEALAQAKESGEFKGDPGEPGKAFIVTITESGDKYTADKIPSEIYAAHNSGVPVLASLMAKGGIVTAYLVTATEDVAMFQVPNFMVGEVQLGATVIIAGNDPADRSVSIVENTIPDSGGNADYELPIGCAELGGVKNGGNVVINEDGTMTAPESSGGGIAVTGATVGQTVKISAVDENGVPTAWEPVDFPSGGSAKWELLTDITLEEDATIEQIDYDAKYKEMYGVITLPIVDPKISTGATCVFLGANLHYVSLGDKNYASLIQVHTTIVDDDTVFVVFRNSGDTGLGQSANIHTRSRPTPWEMRKCKFGVALPTGTTIKVFGKE